jgi:hypothetical protein
LPKAPLQAQAGPPTAEAGAEAAAEAAAETGAGFLGNGPRLVAVDADAGAVGKVLGSAVGSAVGSARRSVRGGGGPLGGALAAKLGGEWVMLGPRQEVRPGLARVVKRKYGGRFIFH